LLALESELEIAIDGFAEEEFFWLITQSDVKLSSLVLHDHGYLALSVFA